MSLKDSFLVAGTQSTLGIVSFLDKPISKTNSILVDILHRLGAVTYVKTNVPQTLAVSHISAARVNPMLTDNKTVDSENNIFGRTLNPWNTMLSPGGSSGGEGALVAFRGSALGVGTDVGGMLVFSTMTADGIPTSVEQDPFEFHHFVAEFMVSSLLLVESHMADSKIARSPA